MQVKQLTDNVYAINAPDIIANGVRDDELKHLLECFNKTGCLIIEELFSEDYIDQLHEAFNKKIANLTLEDFRKKNYELGNKRFHMSMEFEPPFDDPALYGNTIIINLMQAILGIRIMLDSYVMVQSLPGSDTQHVHRDVPPLFLENPSLSGQMPTYGVTVIVPLVAIDQRVGSTVLWPGSHKNMALSAQEHAQQEGAMYPALPKGSAFMWDIRLTHMGMANLSDTPRPILSMVYTKHWFVDSGNFQIEPPIYITQERYDNIPENLKGLFTRLRWLARP